MDMSWERMGRVRKLGSEKKPRRVKKAKRICLNHSVHHDKVDTSLPANLSHMQFVRLRPPCKK